jgi:hypothetical protein
MHNLMLAAWLACQSMDATTTTIALHNGLVEGNPVMRRGPLYIRAGVNLSTILAYRHVNKSNQKVIGWSMAASGCLAGGWNLTQLAKEAR